MNNIREAAVAGLFYPDKKEDLASDVNRYLKNARASALSSTDKEKQFDGGQPKAIIVPHAGYVYSAMTAAKAYIKLTNYVDTITRIILLGPAHRVYLKGLALSTATLFRTPLGDVPTDLSLHERLVQHPFVQIMNQAHSKEHSLEVQLPFLQVLLNKFTVLPIVIGDADVNDVLTIIESLWGGQETLIVISSDLSHFENYLSAQTIDKSTCHAIESLSPELIKQQQACGSIGIKGLLRAAKRHELGVRTLDLCNSGDTAGDRNRVVGYGSWAFTPEASPDNTHLN